MSSVHVASVIFCVEHTIRVLSVPLHLLQLVCILLIVLDVTERITTALIWWLSLSQISYLQSTYSLTCLANTHEVLDFNACGKAKAQLTYCVPLSPVQIPKVSSCPFTRRSQQIPFTSRTKHSTTSSYSLYKSTFSLCIPSLSCVFWTTGDQPFGQACHLLPVA